MITNLSLFFFLLTCFSCSDLLLLYIQLPGHRGVECSDYVRSSVENHNVRILQENTSVLSFTLGPHLQEQKKNIKIGQNWASRGYRLKRMHEWELPRISAESQNVRGAEREPGLWEQHPKRGIQWSEPLRFNSWGSSCGAPRGGLNVLHLWKLWLACHGYTFF